MRWLKHAQAMGKGLCCGFTYFRIIEGCTHTLVMQSFRGVRSVIWCTRRLLCMLPSPERKIVSLDSDLFVFRLSRRAHSNHQARRRLEWNFRTTEENLYMFDLVGM